MSKIMKAAVVTAFDKPLSIKDVPAPEVGPDQILMKVEFCGVCGTDVSAARGEWAIKPTLPFVPGHEGVGHVAAVGRNVKNVKEGDRVGVPFMHSAFAAQIHIVAVASTSKLEVDTVASAQPVGRRAAYAFSVLPVGTFGPDRSGARPSAGEANKGPFIGKCRVYDATA